MKRSDRRRIATALAAAWALLAVAAACNKNPLSAGEVSNRRAGTRDPALVSVKTTTAADGSVTGSYKAAAKSDQTIAASADGALAGAAVTVPAGALPFDMDITLKPAATIASHAAATALGVSGFSQTGQAVQIVGSVPTDAAVPFTLSIPLPTGASLAAGVDPYALLVVLYDIKKHTVGGEFSGVFPRASLTVKDGVVSFPSQYFGTFQAALTNSLVTTASEQQGKPTAPPKRVYFVRGPKFTVFDADSQVVNGYQAWGLTRTPSATAGLTSGYVVRLEKGE